MREENKEFLGIAMTAAVVAYWGFTTVLMKHALLYMSSVTYIMLRFCVAAVLVLAVYGRRLLRAASPSLLLHGLVLGLLQPVFAMLGGAVIADEFGNREPITANMLLGAAVILPALIWYIHSTTGSAGTVSRSA